MEWYYILFIIVCTFLVLKTILSWIFGDIDVDIDFDGDIDFDLSSVFSFKGILHFLFGFSGYLSLLSKYGNYSILNDFEWYHYGIATIIGCIFMYILWYIYKSMMKFNHANYSNPDYNNCECTVITNLGNGEYVVNVKTKQGIITKTFKHTNKHQNIPIGSTLKVIKNKNNMYELV